MSSVTTPPTRVLSLTAALVALLLGVLVPFAAAQPPTGRIAGTVTLRGSGEPLHNVALILLGTSRATVTDDEGRYEFDGLGPGEYTLLVEKEGYLPQKMGAVDANKDINVGDIAVWRA